MTRTNPAEATTDPWERQPGESAKAYQAFKAYRDMPPAERSVRKSGGDSKGTARERRFLGWSSEFRWVERAAAWDGHLDRIRQAERIRSIRQAERQNQKAVDLGFGKLVQRLQAIEKLELTEGQLLTHLDRFVRLRMAVFGQEPPPEKPKPDRSAMLAELAEVKAKAKESGDWNLYFRALQEERVLSGDGAAIAVKVEGGGWRGDLQGAGIDPDEVFDEAVRIAMARMEGQPQ